MSKVEYTIDGPVAIVAINRPRVRNAVDTETAAELARSFQRFEEDADLSVAVLTGLGGAFCAGFDLKALAAMHGNELAAGADGPMGPTRSALSKPTIAAIEGYAVAGGLELALWCDLRVAGRGAVFGVFNRRWGVPLVDGGTVRLPRLVGMGRALDIILTGRPVDAEEALRIGLADRLVESGGALEAAVSLARELAAFPQECLRSDRLSAYEQWGLGTVEALRHEALLGAGVIESGEAASGAARFAAGAGRHGEIP